MASWRGEGNITNSGGEVNLRADAPRPKQPFVAWREFQTRIARRVEIAGWFDSWPDAGVAIVTGMVSGIAVVDVDPRNGGQVEEWQSCSSVAQDTMSGGAHFFVAYDPAIRAQKLPGTDIKSNGGYVVVAPSRAHDGRQYTWRGESLAKLLQRELPAATALLAKLREHQVTSQGAARDIKQGPVEGPWIAETLAHPERVVPGTQEETLTRLAYYLADKHDEDIAFSILVTWAAQTSPQPTP